MTKANQELLKIARRAIESVLEKKEFVPAAENAENLRKQGVFVTLTQDKHLRGCIGCIESSTPLFKTVAEMAGSAAFQDTRFSPLIFAELPSLNIEISVLSSLKKIQDIEEIQVGTHGVVVRQGACQGLFLPQVGQQTGWDRETFLAALCTEKMGLGADAWRQPGAEVFIFTVEAFEEHR